MVKLTVSSNVANLSDTVTADCKLIQGTSDNFDLSISVDGGEAKTEESPDLTENITITRRKPNLTVTCKIIIRDNKKELLTKEETLTVHYPPEFSESLCPDSIVWVEGNERLFGCRSEGNPTPEEKCTLDLANLPLQTTTTFSAERNMSGIYTCQASNLIGTMNKSVEVTVQYPPEIPTVDISTASISVGGFVNITCHSDALPPPTYSWEIPPHAQVDFFKDNRSITIREASLYHNGTYTCHVKNKHGNSSTPQNLEVKSGDKDNTTSLTILGFVGGAILVAIIIGVICYFYHQRDKKGFYPVEQNCNSGEIPMPEINTA
ncbi:hypothetical protein AB205_0147450 [Aquarana catesbeiana]|uniref:Ig-like domain-containing protein n=1 Tax=Aquarana catesbeiana TaxID=8400 RepID=A0A2G9NBL9_AQUCT|nr:hypothetical protein AB205_0147450 [Aquarana catesbeiana]